MYDLREIKSIQCTDVARKYGIELKPSNGKLWGKLRSEKTSSFNIDPKKNLWYDFGLGKGGSVIDLLMELEGISKETAINRLAEEYGFNHEQSTGWKSLTDAQYKEIGIHPERATMNFGFDLNKHKPEHLEIWSKKYGMHVKDLALKYPTVYNKMISKIGMENINPLRDTYIKLLKSLQDPLNSDITKVLIKSTIVKTAEQLNRKVELFEKAFINSKQNYSSLKVSAEKDLSNIEKVILQDRSKITNAYKKLFNYNKIDYFTDEQIKALKDINRVVSNSDNKFLPIDVIKRMYKMIGERLESLDKEYKNVVKDAENTSTQKHNDKHKNSEFNIDKIKGDILKTTDLFCKLNIVIDGIREASLAIKNEAVKQNNIDKPLQNSAEITI